MFTEIEHTEVLLLQRGLYRVCPVYHRRGLLYAKSGGGFVALKESGHTSLMKQRVVGLNVEEALCVHKASSALAVAAFVETGADNDFRPLADDQKYKLLEAS